MPLKVAQRHVAAIAHGFWQELEAAGATDLPLQSSGFLKLMDRASTSRHENRSGVYFEREGLKLPIPLEMKDIGLPDLHPFLPVEGMLRTMALHEKLSVCLFGSGGFEQLALYWQRFQTVCPQFKLFHDRDPTELRRCLPVYLHADEGRYLKREQVLVLNWQSAIGHGTRAFHEGPASVTSGAQGLNFIGHWPFTDHQVPHHRFDLHLLQEEEKTCWCV